MRNKKIIPALLFLISTLIVLSPVIAVQGNMFNCPSTQAGDTKILKVTTVDENGLQAIFGSGWKTVLNTSFGGSAATLGAKFKTIVQGIETDDQISLYGVGLVTVCNITVDYWDFTTEAFLEANKTTIQVYVIKDPANLTAYVQAVRTLLASPGDVTVPWAANVVYGAFLGQLAVPPGDYLNDITWDNGWTTPGNKIVHDVIAPYVVPFTGFTYQLNCTETWSYYDNGALIGYSLVNDQGKTVYKYSIVLPGTSIPGYESFVFITISVIVMIGLVFYMKRKR